MFISDIKGIHLPKSQITKPTFDALVESAKNLFGKNGYMKTTIGDITKNANVAIGTFYIYFDSKYVVYEYILAKYKKDLKRQLALSTKDCKTREEKEKAGLRTFILEAVKDPVCYHLVWESLYINPDLFKKYYSSFAEDYAEAMQKDREELKCDDYQTMAYIFIGISNFMGLQAIFNDMGEEEIERIVDNAILMLKNGLFK